MEYTSLLQLSGHRMRDDKGNTKMVMYQLTQKRNSVN